MRKAVPVFLALVLVSSVRAEPAAPWTVDDVVMAESAADFRYAPEGNAVVWVKRVPDRERGEQVAQLVRTDLDTGRSVVLTRGSDDCTSPRWSPDGKLLAFLSSRPAGRAKKSDDDKVQVWLIDPYGGEPWVLTDLSRGVAAFSWAGPDALVVASQEEPTLRETAREEKKDTTQVIEEEKHEPPARLYKVAVGSRKVTRLTDNADRIESVAVSPDGRYAVTTHSRSLRFVYDNRIKPVVFLHDLSMGTSKQVLAEPKWNIQGVRWAPDGRGFYAVDLRSSRPEFSLAGILELYWYDLAGGAVARIDLGWERGLAEQSENEDAPGFSVTPDGFVALLADGVRHKAARYVRNGVAWKREWLSGPNADRLFGIQTSPDGKELAYAHAAGDRPTRWCHASLTGATLGEPKELAALYGQFEKRTRARVEVVRWKGALGDEVEGLLYYPHAFKPGTKAPLIVMIHGGPAGADLDAWEEWWMYCANLYCQRGAFVLKVNYHGSSNYGLKWMESISGGRYLDLEPADVETGVDQLIGRGLVDPARLGLYGWSNGAIIVNALTTQTTRYRAAVTGAGSVEYVSDWALCEFGDAFDRFYFGKSPLEDAALYLKKSPFFRLEKVRTPTLIFHGAEDRIVPAHQGWVYYRALQQLGKAEVRFVLFPGEKHSLKKLSHRRRKLEEELAWFDRHLFGAARPEDLSLKADSPLAWALKRQAARRDGRRYGIIERGVLVPETVLSGGMRVGRFEVTRAQFTAFDPKYPLEPGRDNHPASGITFEQARAYCEWLSKTTGRAYRLPNEEEADELYEGGETQENTLDAWAGYAPNPEDAARLRAKVADLGAGALLREVGSFRGTGTGELVFDLGGNVAEWVVARDGKGLLRGGSADRAADARRVRGEAAPDYRGFRILLEVK
jgi:dipeptidyl aminopeptidase/acylaminoacyl peptidase